MKKVISNESFEIGQWRFGLRVFDDGTRVPWSQLLYTDAEIEATRSKWYLDQHKKLNESLQGHQKMQKSG